MFYNLRSSADVRDFLRALVHSPWQPKLTKPWTPRSVQPTLYSRSAVIVLMFAYRPQDPQHYLDTENRPVENFFFFSSFFCLPTKLRKSGFRDLTRTTALANLSTTQTSLGNWSGGCQVTRPWLPAGGQRYSNVQVWQESSRRLTVRLPTSEKLSSVWGFLRTTEGKYLMTHSVAHLSFLILRYTTTCNGRSFWVSTC